MESKKVVLSSAKKRNDSFGSLPREYSRERSYHRKSLTPAADVDITTIKRHSLTVLGQTSKYLLPIPLKQWEKRETPPRSRDRRRSNKNEQNLIAKLRVVARLAIVCQRLIRVRLFEGCEFYEKIKPYLSTTHFNRELNDNPTSSLFFDVNKFKLDRQQRMSKETISILQKPISHRTEKDINYVLISLRNVKAFAEYPARMQRKIAQVGLYERYESRRIIVMQGHPARSYYFILSGSVVVFVVADGMIRPVAKLDKGKAFGELAIINKTTRQSSIVTKETTEFLSIDIQDFHKIFMFGGLKNITDPDHVKFLRSLYFLDGWPIEKLTERSGKCIFHYFKNGEVLVRDSHYTDWIVIVKSGSVHVIKKLKQVRVSPRKPTFEQSMSEEERYRLQMKVAIISPTDNSSRFPSLRTSARREHTTHSNQHPGEEHWVGSSVYGHMKDQNGSSTIRDQVTYQVTDHRGRRLTRKRSKKNLTNGHLPGDYHTDNNFLKGSSTAEFKDLDKDLLGSRQEIRTIADDLHRQLKFKDTESDADKDPAFVHVQTLFKGDVLGLTDIVLEVQPTVCAVSNGADCILLDKNFYLQHASESLLERVRVKCSPLPSDEELQEQFRISVEWGHFKDYFVDNTIQRLLETKRRRCILFQNDRSTSCRTT